MAGNELPPVVARLIADTADFIAGFRAAQDAVMSFAGTVVEARDVVASMSQTMREVGASTVVADDEVIAATDEMAAATQRAAVASDELAAAQDRQATAAKDSAASSDVAKSGFGALGGMATVATLAVVGVAAAGIKMATDFQASTVRLVTSAGEIQSNLQMVQDGILQMSGQVGVGSKELADAMYYVESAGFHAADGLTVLKAAAQGAKAEGASTTDVVKAMTDVLKDYHLPASDAANVTSQMIAAVANGKTSLEDFSKAFASIIPAASAAGVSFADAGSALAEMTNHGFTAQRASQNLAQALRSLLNPTGPMVKAFKEFGVSSDELKAKLAGPNGLTDAMQYLSESALKAGNEGTPAFAAALKRLMGTAPGANAALTVVGANFKDTTATIQAMTKATADGQGQVKGFAEVQGNFGQTMSRVKDAAAALATKLGMELLPIITKGGAILASFLGDVTSTLNSMGSSVGSFLGQINLQPVIAMFQSFANVIKTQVVPIVKDAAKIIGPALVVAFGVFIGAIQAAIAVVHALLTPLKGLFDFMAQHATVFQAIAVGIMAVVVAMKVWAAIQAVVTLATKAWAVAQAALDVVMDANPIMLIVTAVIALAAAFVYLWTHSAGFRDFWIGLWNGIKSVVSAVVNWLIGAFHAVVGFFGDAGRWLLDAGINIVRGLWNGIASAMSWLWNQITSFANSIVGGFKSALGISSPSKLMADNVGVHITRGIAQGMMDGMPHVHAAIASIKDTVTGGNYGAGSFGGMGGMSYAALATGGGGTGVLVINNNIQGTVVGESQLSDVLRTQVLRYNQRNPTNGLSLFGRGTT